MVNWQGWSQAIVLIVLSVLILPIHVYALLRIRKESAELANRRKDLINAVKLTSRGRRR